jgi:NAD(P)H-hydrate repair Nnr-like enzyme with NAD(P)H-hydrate epimerase domain
MITPILRSPELRAVEARHADADPPLMARAGAALAAAIERMLPDAEAPLLMVAGPGTMAATRWWRRARWNEA